MNSIPPKKILQIRVAADILERIKLIGQLKYPELSVSQNKLMEMALREYVERHAPEAPLDTKE